jgi:hypothetical protein
MYIIIFFTYIYYSILLTIFKPLNSLNNTNIGNFTAAQSNRYLGKLFEFYLKGKDRQF